MADETRVEYVPESDYGSPDEYIQHAVSAVNRLINGEGNNHHFATLRPDETTTEVLIPDIKPGAVAILTAQSASAALETGMWAEVVQNKVVIHHASGSGTDRKFGVVTNG